MNICIIDGTILRTAVYYIYTFVLSHKMLWEALLPNIVFYELPYKHHPKEWSVRYDRCKVGIEYGTTDGNLILQFCTVCAWLGFYLINQAITPIDRYISYLV